MTLGRLLGVNTVAWVGAPWRRLGGHCGPGFQPGVNPPGYCPLCQSLLTTEAGWEGTGGRGSWGKVAPWEGTFQEGGKGARPQTNPSSAPRQLLNSHRGRGRPSQGLDNGQPTLLMSPGLGSGPKGGLVTAHFWALVTLGENLDLHLPRSPIAPP